MKQLVALVFLFVLAFPGYGDATLTFTTYSRGNDLLLTYYIKDGMLRYNEQDSNKINLYSQSNQLFLSMNRKQQTISRIDKDIIEQRTKSINKQRLDKIEKAEAELNEKLKTMSPEQHEAAASLLNQLKYPEFYGAHTFLKVAATNEQGKVNGFACNIYRVTRKDTLVKTICMASADTLGLSAGDYNTLRDFLHFNYLAQTRMMIAAGKTDFNFIDYEQENMPGIAVLIVEADNNPNRKPSLQIQDISTKMLEPSLFEIQIPRK